MMCFPSGMLSYCGSPTALLLLSYCFPSGMLSYCGLAGSDNVNVDPASSEASTPPRTSRLEIWRNDGVHEIGPPVEFEHLDQARAAHPFRAATSGRPARQPPRLHI